MTSLGAAAHGWWREPAHGRLEWRASVGRIAKDCKKRIRREDLKMGLGICVEG